MPITPSAPNDEPVPAGPAHLAAALVAGLVFLALLAVLHRVAETQVRRNVESLAPLFIPQKTLGLIAQREAFAHADFLPVYGASEMVENAANQATGVFSTYPGGFAVFAVADLGAPLLTQVLRLAAVGPAMRGRPVVLTMTPLVQLWRPRVRLTRVTGHLPQWVPPELQDFVATQRGTPYEGTFSPLQAWEIAYSGMDPALLRQVAARLLWARRTVADLPVLHVTLEALTSGDRLHRAEYFLLMPLGLLERELLRSRDAWRMVTWLAPSAHRIPARREPRSIDWAALARDGEDRYRPTTANNDFGLDSAYWRKLAQRDLVPKTDSGLARALRRPGTWADFDLVLEVLAANGARTLVIALPYPGKLADHLGISPEARQGAYDMLRVRAEARHASVLTFADHDEDRWFLLDGASHPSPKGWALIDEALDRFYHDSLP